MKLTNRFSQQRVIAKKGHLSTFARQVGLDNGDLAAGHQEYENQYLQPTTSKLLHPTPAYPRDTHHSLF